MGKFKKTLQHRVTIKDIAAMAGVSNGTVDRVLHHRGEVNLDTHERVMSFVDKLGYKPNLLAKSLAMKKNFFIAVLIPEAGNVNQYWKEPFEGFTRASEELNDYSTRIEFFNYDLAEERSFISSFNRVLASRPDGVIMAPNFHDAALRMIPRCKEQNIPFMFIDNNLEGQSLAYFGQDALQSGIVAARLMCYGIREDATVLVLNIARNKAITRHMEHRASGFTGYISGQTSMQRIDIVTASIDLAQEGEPDKTLKKLISKHKDVKGIFVTNSRVHRVASALSSLKNLMLIGYDLTDDNIRLMEEGIINVLICQKPADQGYKSAMAMFDFLLTGKLTGKINFSPIDIIIKENINYYRNINHT